MMLWVLLTSTLADGSVITRKVSECYIILPQGEGHTPVILGEAYDEALLGVVTLEILGLVFDPFKRRLQPMRMLLKRGSFSSVEELEHKVLAFIEYYTEPWRSPSSGPIKVRFWCLIYGLI